MEDAPNHSCGAAWAPEAVDKGVTGPWHTPAFHSDVWVNPGICVSILLLLFPCDCSELNGLNYGANYLKVNASTVMMEVFVVFSPIYHKLFREREKDHSGLIKSFMDCVSACVTESSPVYRGLPGVVGRRKRHNVPSECSNSNHKCSDA